MPKAHKIVSKMTQTCTPSPHLKKNVAGLVPLPPVEIEQPAPPDVVEGEEAQVDQAEARVELERAICRRHEGVGQRSIYVLEP